MKVKRLRITEAMRVYPLPWRHRTDGGAQSAVVAANGIVVCGSLASRPSSPDANREAHALIVDRVNGSTMR